MLTSKYELDTTTTQYWVITIFNWIRYVMLWPWPLTFWPWSHVTWCHLGGQSVYQLPSLNMIRLTVPELGRLQFSIERQLKVPIFPFLGVMSQTCRVWKFHKWAPHRAPLSQMCRI